MDRRVKERLVGATILVVLVVLIVPELLSGPKRPANSPAPAAVVAPAEPVRNVTVDLATSKATPEEEATAASAVPTPPVESPPAATVPSGAAPSDEPAPAGATRAPAAAPPTVTTLKAQQPAAPALENEISPPKSPPVVSKSGAARETVPDSSHHGWAVQLGSFASHANAEKLVHELKAHDSSAYVSSSGSRGSLRYRVRIGPLADRAAAERVQLKLKKEGRPASLIPP